MKKLIKHLTYTGIFVIALIISFAFFVKNKKYDIVDAFNSFYNIDSANINIKTSQKITNYNRDDIVGAAEDNSNDNILNNISNMNLFYKFNYQKKFTDNKYEGVSIADGIFGIEDEELKLGMYIPIQIVKLKDNVEVFAKIEEEYNIFDIPSNQIYFNVNSLFNNTRNDFKSEDLYELKNDLFNILKDYFKNNKNKYRLIKYDSKNLLDGTIGAFIYNLQEEDFDEILNSINKNIDKELLKTIPINEFLVNNKTFLLTSTLRIDVYKNYISNISIENKERKVVMEILNINNKNNIESMKKEECLNLLDYLNDKDFDINSLFNNKSDNTINYLNEKFNELIIYMTSVFEYSESGDFDKAEISLDYINNIISEMEEKDIGIEDKEMFKNYLALFKSLEKYTILYKQSLESSNSLYEDKLLSVVQEITNISKVLGIELNIPNK